MPPANERPSRVVASRKNRRIGIEVSLVYMPNEDPTCRWQTECEHGNCVGHTTRRLAESFLAVPWEWCSDCAGLVPHAEAHPRTPQLAADYGNGYVHPLGTLEARRAKREELLVAVPAALKRLGVSRAWVRVVDLRDAFPDTSREGLDSVLLELRARIEHRSPNEDPIPALRLLAPSGPPVE